MNIALCQIDVKPGKPEHNLKSMRAGLQRSKDAGAELAIFPELCVSGYLLGDLWNDKSFCRELMAYNNELVALSSTLPLVWGNLLLDESKVNKDGRFRRYNAVFGAQDGRGLTGGSTSLPAGVSVKTLLPNYRFFEDSRYFYSLLDLANEEGKTLDSYTHCFDFTTAKGIKRLGLEICEDLWFPDYSLNGKPLNITALLADQGADLIINVSASPWSRGKNQSRHRRVAEALDQAKTPCPFIYVNCCGVQNNGKNFLTFDGASAAYARNGELKISIEQAFLETEIIIDSDTLDLLPRLEPKEESAAAMQFKAAVRGLQALDDILGSNTWPLVIGVSGGIDSAVSLCLAEKAFGKDRIRAFNLPSVYNSEATKTIAMQLAEALGIRYESIPIQTIVEATNTALSAYKPSVLNLENIQAKTRGTAILSNLAGILGGLMCNNGNKVEFALGYATLYGDVNGAICPLGDLCKTEVFELARYMNTYVYKTKIIPESLLPDQDFNFIVPPSAELKPQQVDPMKWGYHDALVEHIMTYRSSSREDFLRAWLDGSLCRLLAIPETLLQRYSLLDGRIFLDDLDWFYRLFALAVFKRIQAPPILVMSRSAFGFDFRESQLALHKSPEVERLTALIRAGTEYGALVHD